MDDVVPAGDSFRVTLRVLGATTVHVIRCRFPQGRLRVPARLRARGGPAVWPAGGSINIASGAALYKKLVTCTEGYVGDVPIIHQAVAVKAAIDAMDAALAEDRDANF